MILGQISLLDCIVFILLLIPQLIIHVGILRLMLWLVIHLPFIAYQIPSEFLRGRYLTPKKRQTPYVRLATPFQDFVIRCVRYAFAYMPAVIGRVFFSRSVALPFLKFRMLRHGILTPPIQWTEIDRPDFKGVWILPAKDQPPDIVILYCHGGGFSMGSSYFYMEFLMAWVSLLQQSGFHNPAVLSVDYTLVPDKAYPCQLTEVFAAYSHVLKIVKDSSRVCVAGDSAGATLILSLQLKLAQQFGFKARKPGFCVMISPWVTILSDKNRNTASDYLDSHSLWEYGRLYLSYESTYEDHVASPGTCKDPGRWAMASPSKGWFFIYGAEEVLAPETHDLVSLLRAAGEDVEVVEEKGMIHAWPVASLFLGESREGRLRGLNAIVENMKRAMV